MRVPIAPKQTGRDRKQSAGGRIVGERCGSPSFSQEISEQTKADRWLQKVVRIPTITPRPARGSTSFKNER